MKKGHLLWNLEVVMEERLAAVGGEVAFWTCCVERYFREKKNTGEKNRRRESLQDFSESKFSIVFLLLSFFSSHIIMEMHRC